MPEKQHCKICGGMRGAFCHNKQILCEGCATPVASCHISDDLLRKINRKPRCPNCRSTFSEEIEKDRYCCKTCDTTFEAPDMGYVDDRPENNAMKNEAYAQANVIRKLRHGGR